MNYPNRPAGYAIRREGNQLRFAVGHDAHRDFMWKIWESMNFGTPNFRPEPGFTPGGEFYVAPLGGYDFTFDVADWDRAVLPRLAGLLVQPLPDGGFRGGDFPTHFQNLVGAWRAIADVLSFAAAYRREKACDMVDLLEIGMTLIGEFHKRRFFPFGDHYLCPEQIIGALHKHYGTANTRTYAPAGMPRALLVLAQEHSWRFENPLRTIESAFGFSIALGPTDENEAFRVLWSTAHLHEDLYGHIPAQAKEQVMTHLHYLLQHWDETGRPERRSKKQISETEVREIESFFRDEFDRLAGIK
jgi:hypothetical protein